MQVIFFEIYKNLQISIKLHRKFTKGSGVCVCVCDYIEGTMGYNDIGYMIKMTKVKCQTEKEIIFWKMIDISNDYSKKKTVKSAIYDSKSYC